MFKNRQYNVKIIASVIKLNNICTVTETAMFNVVCTILSDQEKFIEILPAFRGTGFFMKKSDSKSLWCFIAETTLSVSIPSRN